MPKAPDHSKSSRADRRADCAGSPRSIAEGSSAVPPHTGRTHADWSIAIVDSLTDAVLVVDRALRVLFRNATAAERFGLGEDLRSLLAGVRFLDAFRGWSQEMERALTQGVGAAFDGVAAWKGCSTPCLVRVHCAPLSEPMGQGAMVLIRVENIDALSADAASPEDADGSRRLASLGKLSAQVAHELNNPLDGILRYVNLSLRMIGDTTESKLRTYLTECRAGLQRMARIISDLLAYSRRNDAEPEVAAVQDVIEQAVRQHAAAARDARVVVALDLHGQAASCVRGSRLFQVCSNLIRNAIDAMPDGGRLTVTHAVIGEDVMIEVADTGSGLPKGDEHRVFEPFFTTKPLGKGTGLGLSICRDFVAEMGGSIHASNGRQGGAVFTVRFPVSPQRRPNGPMPIERSSEVGP